MLPARKPPSSPLQKRTRKASAPDNHRARTGAAKREQTRRKLLTAALAVFAEKGTETPQIDDFIAVAKVARGTFYNYFKTTQELLDAVTAELGSEVLVAVEDVVLRIDDPLKRISTALLLYMHLAVDLPNWGAFVLRTGFRSEARPMQVDTYLPRDLELARKLGEIDIPAPRAARDLVLASANQAIQSVLSGQAPREHLRETWALTLRGLGVRARRVRELCATPLPAVALPELLRPQAA